ncbi:hypothetical protein DQ04_00231200 [Trypanosoma grayi]|uniref:hypothetical protein n=1 Tax=Trypanosoma grayi TaxID=71804 RepID=UPI0004F43316|nr:hypothetical protein DQ04_00231200 [Trypanosoma grayi]KEG14994.1 hypothetical protein DQ04_00231200 [Trypanosoma grayi]
MPTNSLADNRALLQVLTHAENTSRSPGEIIKSAIAGGVVAIVMDEDNRYAESVLMPSSSDLTTLVVLITEGFFAPVLRHAAGDQLPGYTVVSESGCFEPLSLPVLLFPDCFLSPPSGGLTPHAGRSPSPQVVNTSDTNMSLDSFPTHLGYTGSTVTASVLQLHKLRSHVAFLLLKNVNEVLHDAEVLKLKVSRQKTQGTASEVVAANAVIALFYEVKMLLICCLVSANRAYVVTGHHTEVRNSAQIYFDELIGSEELHRMFEQRVRPTADDVAKWYDTMLDSLLSVASAANSGLQELVDELQAEVAEEHRWVGGLPLQLLHRPHDAASTTALQLHFAHVELPRMEVQPGEAALFYDSLLDHHLLFDSETSKICLLLRRSATAKLTLTQLRDAEEMLSRSPWHDLRSAVRESVCRYLSNDGFFSSMLEKNGSFVARLVHWLRESSQQQQQVEDEAKKMRVEKTEESPAITGAGVEGADATQETGMDGASLANDIIERAVRVPKFSAAIVQFIREMINYGALRETQLHTWVACSLPELENKPSATIGLFALLMTFSLAQQGWDLPEEIREASIKLCTQHRQQPDCLTLLNLLRRHSQ